jgi:predicted phosphohydrolase
MRLFAIGDTHLSGARAKPMDIFGPNWVDHDKRIREHWNAIATNDDVLLVAGDISWAMDLGEARVDLEFLASFRGRKLLLRGNHDYWWGSISRLRSEAPVGIEFLQNDAHIYDGVAVIGTRGWLLPSDAHGTEEDRRIFARELERLRLSLADLRRHDFDHLVTMTHYPPLRALTEATPMTEIIEAAGASICVYGHLHGHDVERAAQGRHNSVEYKLVSADAVNFVPWQVWPPAASAERRLIGGTEAGRPGL